MDFRLKGRMGFRLRGKSALKLRCVLTRRWRLERRLNYHLRGK